MKKILIKICGFFLAILAILFFGICIIIMLPLDYFKYKRSYYYKVKRKKYRLFIASGTHFDVYNEVLKNDLPIRFVENPQHDLLECGWFVLNDLLIIVNVFSFEFDADKQEWQYVVDDEEERRVLLTLDEYIDSELQEINDALGQNLCNRAVVLIDSDMAQVEGITEYDSRFLLYSGNRAEILKALCENETPLNR